MNLPQLKIEGRADGHWIVGLPNGFLDCGPYTSQSEAREAKRGIERFFRDELPGWEVDSEVAMGATMQRQLF